MAQHDDQLHFILFPFMAQGHMIPIIDIARLFAQRGMVVTIVTTHHNYLRFKTITDRATQSDHLPIRILQLYFPSVEVGLPGGCENVDTIPTRDMIMNFFKAISMLQQPLEQALGEMEPRPSCLISDNFLPWTSETARKFDIPRLIFHGTSCFYLLCSDNIFHYKAHESVTSESEPFIIPGLPDLIEISKSQLPDQFNRTSSETGDLHYQVREAELTAYGVVINSFFDLEPTYIKEYQKVKKDKAWCIGPVSLCNQEALEKFERGDKASIDQNHCVKWLDSRKPNSVIYVSLGSMCRLTPKQFMEIGLGLEASQQSFIWVVKGAGSNRYGELETWLTEVKFEERAKDRGLVIKGWAPQVLILSHPAIGGFLTHCGWNSTLEGVCAGVPMITWPMFAEQFLNEKLIVQILGIGVAVGALERVSWGDEDDVLVLITREEVEKAISRLMHEDDEGIERRKKARELGIMARKAMEKGGSSYLGTTLLIEDIKQQVNKKISNSNSRR
ncbi:Glycosyltransferase [Thalictrum thalictroides]|uniref:Glycosyltransferase n=1 Tax=Thalictrum thalictroides TaxID=46969 RepID=A0A7J6VMB7_THATH|nr:Glycosyltransferase [Thalictrum thalictroides]